MIPDFISRRRDIPASAKLVYGFLVRCEGKAGSAFPSNRAISEAVGLSPRQVQNCIALLQKRGILRATKRVNQHGQSSNLYEFIWREWMDRGEVDCVGSTQQAAHRIEQPEYNREEEHDCERVPAITATPRSPELSRALFLAHAQSVPGSPPPTDAQVDTIRRRCAFAAGRPVDDAEIARLLPTIPMPRKRAQRPQEYAWWASTLANEYAAVRAAAESFRPEEYLPSVEIEHASHFAAILDGLDPDLPPQ